MPVFLQVLRIQLGFWRGAVAIPTNKSIMQLAVLRFEQLTHDGPLAIVLAIGMCLQHHASCTWQCWFHVSSHANHLHWSYVDSGSQLHALHATYNRRVVLPGAIGC